MNYNLNSGYGQQQAASIDKLGAGKVFIVGDSSTANLNMLEQMYIPDPDGTLRFFSTIDAAINVCTASAGDIIYVMPGHTETLATASAITADVAGVSIIGLGHGADRPTLTFSATASTFVVSAASVKIKNIIVACSIDAVVSAFVVSGADCELDIESRDASTSIEFTNIVLTTADADNLKIKLKHDGFTGGSGNTNAIRLVGGTNTRIDIDYFGLASTAVVEFHTTSVIDANVSGYMYNYGTTDFTKSVIDTVGSSSWYAEFHDGGAGQYVSGGSGEALAAGDLSAISTAVGVIDGYHDVPTKDATTDTVMRDVIGKKDDTAVGTPTTTKSLMAYLKGALEDTAFIGTIVNAGGTATLGAALGDFANDTLIARLDDIGSNIDSATTDNIQGKIGTDSEMADRSLFDLLGGDGFATAYPTANIPAADVSVAEVLREAYDQGEKAISGATAVMVNGNTLFTIAGGPIKIIELVSVCITSNDGTASTLQYSADPTVGAAITFSGASASLANFAAGGGVVLNQTALNTAPDLSVVLVALGSVVTNNIIVNEGIITAVVGTGSTTGTWKHYLRYKPLGRGVTVVGT